MEENFVHLHVHTEFSLLDGAAKIKQLVALSAERGNKAVAITDHGNMYGTLQFYTECLTHKIKPIIGEEFYVCDDHKQRGGKPILNHLILLAKNNEGYKNLLKLSSISFVDGFYYKPRIDYDLLEQYHEGIICLSACLAGSIPQLILQNRLEDAEKLALRLKNIFGEDFYLEIQDHGIEEQKLVMVELAKMSKKLGIKLVATNDVHYINKEDAEMQDVLMCVQMGKQIDDPDRLKFQTQEFYLKTYEEMALAFQGYEEALATTVEIADKCDVVIKSKLHGELGLEEKYVLPASKNYIPQYQPENGMTCFEFLKDMTYKGLKKKYKVLTPEILERAESELTLIHDLGFVEYSIVVWDYINYARSHDIPVGPGRGSGAGSIVAYAISITLIDPLKYDLIFERFIHKERVSMPDFDVDFDYDRRGEVIDYVRRRYTNSNVALIVTFGTMAAKNALRDVARVLRMPYSEVDKISKEIPDKLPEGIKKPPVLKYYFGVTGKPENDKFIVPALKKMYDEDQFLRRIVDMAVKLEGFPRNTSTHAAGVLIAPDRVDNFVPLSRNGDDITTQYNMIELEQLGLLKMDFLGLRTLTDIDKAIKLVEKIHGVKIDFYDMEYDDPKVYELISSGDTDAIFQLESAGMKKFMKELKPDCLEDIIAGVSLYRPGPMDSIPRYVKNKQNPDKIVYAHPCLEPILNVTYGCIVYQEQVMKVLQVMGGYNMGQADNVRRIMGKKKVEKMAYEREKFINGWKDPTGKSDIPGAIKLGIPKEVAEQVFSEMESFASYAFNKSHAAAYAHLSYQTAYLRCYYEIEFLTAVLNNRITNADEIKKYVTYTRKQGHQVLPPDINKSETYFSVENGNLRFGLGALKNVGVQLMEEVIAERDKNGPFKNFDDFINRVSQQALNKRCIEALILSGAFDTFGKSRSQLMAVYEIAVDKVSKDRKSKAKGQFSLFDNMELKTQDQTQYPDIREFNRETKLKFEKDILGVYISGHPLEEYMDKYKDFTLTSDMLEPEEIEEDDEVKYIYNVKDGTPVTCGGILTKVKKHITKADKKEMAMISMEDIYGTIEIMAFPKVYTKYKDILKEDDLFTVAGRLSIRDGEAPVVMAESFVRWSAPAVKDMPKNQKLCLKFDMQNKELYNKVYDVLLSYKGDAEVFSKCTTTDKKYKMPVKVNMVNHLINELNGLIGEENVIVVGDDK